mmetsp:Transcript_2835/g.7753  ORF Transcript_2835/g.7753 Transcript_2835/m.7753 type:complete len:86 (+) Transcript_2835:1497-1754(+)
MGAAARTRQGWPKVKGGCARRRRGRKEGHSAHVGRIRSCDHAPVVDGHAAAGGVGTQGGEDGAVEGSGEQARAAMKLDEKDLLVA